MRIGRQLFKDVFGISLLFLVIGAGVSVRRRRWCESFGLLGFVAYLIVVARGNYAHDYYQLAIIPIAPAVVALGLEKAVGRAGRGAVAYAVCLGLILFSTFVRSASFHSWYEWGTSEAELCQQSPRFLMPRDRLLFVGDNDPKLMFCMDRSGWLKNPAESDAAHLDEALGHGATIAVLPRSLDS